MKFAALLSLLLTFFVASAHAANGLGNERGAFRDGSGTTVFNYDHRGNLTAKRQKLVGTPGQAPGQAPDWVYLRYSYDLGDRVEVMTYPSGRQVRYVRDAKGRVTGVRTRASAAVTTWTIISSNMGYEPFGALKGITYGNGERLIISRGDDGRMDGRRLFKTADGSNVSFLSYGYDLDDNITRITDKLNADNNLTFAYDEAGRLKRVTTATGTTRRTDYVFDGNGNRLRTLTRPLPDDPPSVALTERVTLVAGTNRLANIRAPAAGNGTGAISRSFTYDARGNLTGETRPNGVSITAGYDGYGRLTSYTRGPSTGSGQSADALVHVYNGLDDRVATTRGTGTTADTRRFVYAPDGRVIGEYGNSASDVKAEFIWLSPEVGDSGSFGGDDGLGGYMPLAVATGSGTATQLSWVHANHMGVPIRYSDSTGATLPQPTGYSVPGFPGQSLTFTDLYYNRYRDYDPTTGRYIQADPIGLAGGASPYSYALNNPLRYSDPTGEFVPLLIIGFLAGFDANLIYQRYQGKGPWQPWSDKENCDPIDFWEAIDVGITTASMVPIGRALKSSEFLFGRHKVGIFNRNDFLRVGRGWEGYPKGDPRGQGREVFRIAFGHRSWPEIPFLPSFPWHF